MALNARQRAFVEAYCGNATEAALQAGYSEKTARITAAKLLSKGLEGEVGIKGS